MLGLSSAGHVLAPGQPMPYIGTITHQRKQYADGMLYRALSVKMWLGLQEMGWSWAMFGKAWALQLAVHMSALSVPRSTDSSIFCN